MGTISRRRSRRPRCWPVAFLQCPKSTATSSDPPALIHLLYCRHRQDPSRARRLAFASSIWIWTSDKGMFSSQGAGTRQPAPRHRPSSSALVLPWAKLPKGEADGGDVENPTGRCCHPQHVVHAERALKNLMDLVLTCFCIQSV